VKTVAGHLINGDFYVDEAIAGFAWPLLVQSAGLAKLDGARLTLTPKSRAALRKPSEEVILGVWRRWLTHGAIDEFSRVEAIKGQRGSNVLSAVKRRRSTGADGLATCPPGEWIEIDDLFATMRRKRLSPTIARSERALWRLHILDPEYGSLDTTDIMVGHCSRADTRWRWLSSTPARWACSISTTEIRSAPARTITAIGGATTSAPSADTTVFDESG
jgi:hypothetical protein